jgi:hypothetical protein
MASAPPSGATGAAPSRISTKELITLLCAIIAPAVVVSGVIRGDGQREQRLQQVETQVRQLEQRDDRRADLLSQIDVRTARIEATLQMITSSKGAAR